MAWKVKEKEGQNKLAKSVSFHRNYLENVFVFETVHWY